MDFLNKVEVVKRYRRSALSCENVDFFSSVIQKFQRLKLMSMVVLFEKNPEFLYEGYFLRFISYFQMTQ